MFSRSNQRECHPVYMLKCILPRDDIWNVRADKLFIGVPSVELDVSLCNIEIDFKVMNVVRATGWNFRDCTLDPLAFLLPFS